MESSGEHGCLSNEKAILSHPEKQEGTLGDKAEWAREPRGSNQAAVITVLSHLVILG